MIQTQDGAVVFDRVSRHFGRIRAVDDVSFEVRDGEFFTFLGPSGSGKTTCLRLIAGFEQADAGRIYISGREAGKLPPYEREVHTVFQDYALFPHMSVAENVAYSLMVKGVPKRERRRRAEEALELVRLNGFADRKPSELSGGQRQRVALARSLVGKPKLLLLDEPLGALDLKLREQMQTELKMLQASVGITFIYVTHDQEEALSMSDRIAVFNHGRIEQLDSPAEIYEHPRTAFVAGFVGTSNMLQGMSVQRLSGHQGALLIRPERIRVLPLDTQPEAGEVAVDGTVKSIVYLGMYTRTVVRLDEGGELTVNRQNTTANREQQNLMIGERVRLVWNRTDGHLLDAVLEPA